MNNNNNEIARLIAENTLPAKLSLSQLANENSSLFLENIMWGSANLLLWVEMELRENEAQGRDMVLTCWLRANDRNHSKSVPLTAEMDTNIAMDAMKRNESPIRACIAASPEFLRKLRAAIPSVDAICSNEELKISVSGGAEARNRRTL